MPAPRTNLAGLFWRFLSYGLAAWGGPVAQIAMFRRDLVDSPPDQRWVEPDKFNRVLAVYQALPGPEATELCCYFGLVRAGRLGAILAGLGFLLPGLVLMLILAEAYSRFGLHPAVVSIMTTVQPAVIALIFVSAFRIARATIKGTDNGVSRGGIMLTIVLLALAMTISAVPFWAVLIAGAIVGGLARPQRTLAIAAAAASISTIWWWPGDATPAITTSPSLIPAAIPPAAGTVPLLALAALGLKAGLLTFGGAYTAIPLLHNGATGAPASSPAPTAPDPSAAHTGGWMTTSQFFDGIALVGILPAPLVTIGAFVGYLGAGLPGALVMSAAIYLPAFAFTLIGHELMERLVENPRVHETLDGIAAAAAGLLLATAAEMALPLLVPGPQSLTRLITVTVTASLLVRFPRRATVPLTLLAFATLGLARWMTN